MPIPDQFFTVESMLTLTGASGSTFLICNGLQRAFNFNPKWLALIVAVALSITGVILTGKTGIIDFVVGTVNGFLIYATAAGATEATSGKLNGSTKRSENEDDVYGAGAASVASAHRRRFNSSWFHQ
ncbi:MAG: hypothetical protein ACXVJD_03140 [Mucilaginibacter sp.]